MYWLEACQSYYASDAYNWPARPTAPGVKTTYRSIEGTFDILPGSASPVTRSEAWCHVEERIRAVMQRFAFAEIRTPVLEPLDLIARGVGELTDIVTKEMFSFERGSTNYVLRPEMTAPVMRAYLQHHLDQRPGEQRLFYMGPCFRAERPQKGRYRQFHQFGAEIIGSTDARADAEIIACTVEIYSALGLGSTLLRINTLGDAESRPRYIQALRAYFEPFSQELSATSQGRLKSNPLRILDTKLEHEAALVQSAPRLMDFVDPDSRAHYEAVKVLLAEVGVPFVEDPFLVRGLDYYSRTAFELESPEIGAQSALAGGGRYDLLSVSVGSRKPVPAVGFAAGMERLLLALEAADAPWPDTLPPTVFLIGLGESAEKAVFGLALRLRQAGLRATHGLRSRSMKAQMRTAHRVGAGYCVIVGDEELASGYAQVKEMTQGVQETVPFDVLPRYLLSHRT